MKNSRLSRLLPPASLLAAALLLALPRPASALFFAASRAVRAADAKLEEGLQAKAEGRNQDALAAFDEAFAAYGELRQKHPDVQPEHVAEKQAECRSQMLALYTDAEAGREAAVETLRKEGPIEIEDLLEELPQNQVHSSYTEGVPPRGALPRAPFPGYVAEPDAEPAALPENASLEERVDFYLKSNRAAEAVVLLDSLLGDDPAQAPAYHRLLLARALVASGNYVRAIFLLDPLVQQTPNDPAVLTLAAGAHFAHGNAFTALQYLDQLVKAHPRYADGYINLAYVRFAMDPEANRDEAVIYYRHALSFGAERDRRLESELGIRIEE